MKLEQILAFLRQLRRLPAVYYIGGSEILPPPLPPEEEAADRLAAVPGTRASSAISCAVNYYATSKLMFTAAPGSFYPAPKVTSAVVRMDIRPTPAVQVEDEAGYFALVRAAFGQRRKTAANAIAGGLNLP